MIVVEIFFNENQNINGFKVQGHAGFAEHGADIVCASVSLLVINTINSISLFAGEKMTVKQDEKIGLIEVFTKNSEPNEKTKLLFDSLELGLKDVANSYKSYIEINVRRCS